MSTVIQEGITALFGASLMRTRVLPIVDVMRYLSFNFSGVIVTND
jgi:hypothetical protein